VTAPLLLTGYALAAGALAPAALRRGWAARAPRFAIGLWLALSISWLAAVVLAILAVAAPFSLTWPASRARDGFPAASHAAPGVTVAGGAGLLAAAVLAWAAGCLARGLAQARRDRRQHAAFLHAAGRPDPALGAVIPDRDAPAAYCLPGHRHHIVLTTGTLTALKPAQLQAVLAHERAHLRGRHHLLLAMTSALRRAFPFVPLLAQADEQVAVLTEMAADDHAARRHKRADLATALITLATTRHRSAALTAGGPAAITRIHRLLAPTPSPGRPARIARLTAGIAALALPAAVALLPLIAAACDAAGPR